MYNIMSLRDRQIREILDENVKYYNEALKRQFQQVRLMDESYAPPNRLEKKTAFDIDKYFIEINNIIDGIISDYTNTRRFNVRDINSLTSTYDTLIAFLSKYASTNVLNQRDLSAIEDKFDSILPKLSQIVDLADNSDLPETNKLNALYNLIEARDYISLAGNTEEVKGRTRMFVDRQQAPIVNPYFEPQPYSPPIPYASVRLRPYREIMRDTRELNEDVVQNEENIDNPARIIASENLDRANQRVRDAYKDYQEDKTQENKDVLERAVDNKAMIEMMLRGVEEPREEREPSLAREPSREREMRRQPRERPANDKELRSYINSIPERELVELIGRMPHVQERLSKIKKGSLFTKLNKNLSLAKDIFSAREEGIMPTEYQESRGRRRTPLVEREREQQQRERIAFPFSETEQEYETSASPMRSEVEGDGRTSFVKTKAGRFQMRGKGESEDKMFGLPFGFKRALQLRPMDRRPIIHYNGIKLDTTLEERMEFLNQLDTQRISNKEFKLNSVKNLSEMKDRKYKK